MSVHYVMSGGIDCWGLFDTHSHTVQTQLIFTGALGGAEMMGGSGGSEGSVNV